MGRTIIVEKTMPKAEIGTSDRREGDASSSEPKKVSDDLTTVFVGNLTFTTDEDSLRDVFSDCGNIVSVRIARDRESGKSRGFGHVEFSK